MLNQAARKFIFTLERVNMVWGHVHPMTPYGSTSAARPMWLVKSLNGWMPRWP